jgi:hypothetical protein
MNSVPTTIPTDIKPTGLMNSCYDFRIVREGREGLAELTYNLNDPSPSRRLLRLRETDALRLFQELPANRQFQQFRDQVKDMKSRGIGNISIAKGMVLDQYDSSQRNPEHGIAVHRMGPVPVFILPETLTGKLPSLNVNGLQIDPIIGIYPSLISGDSATRTLYKQDLLRSYNIQLDIMLQKYLEDTGEHFHDIENYVPRRDVLIRAKQAETVLKQSLEEKIQLILSHAERDIDPDLHSLARKVWDAFSVSIMTAALARVFALHLLNELYRILGIADRSAKYEQDWGGFSAVFGGLCAESDFEDLFVPGSELFLLREARKHYLAQSDDDDFEALQAQAEAREIRWVQDFTSFARFVAGLRRESPSVGTGRLFMSLQHNVSAAAGFFQSVNEYVRNQTTATGQPRVQILAVRNESPGTDIERLVKSRIWLSDLLLAVIPREWETSAIGEQKDLAWVVREVDYGLLLERLLRLFIEEGVDRDRVLQAFEADISPIAPTHGRYNHGHRKERRVRKLRDVVNNSFTYRADTHLSADLQTQIDLVIGETRERHARDVITGFLRQFEDPQMILKILSLTNFAQTKNWICNQIADEQRAALLQQRMSPALSVQEKKRRRIKIEKDVAEYRKRVVAKFERARVAIADRGLMIHGQELHLLQTSGSRSKLNFKSNLRGILKILMPDSDDQHLVTMHKRVFTLVLESTSVRLVA